MPLLPEAHETYPNHPASGGTPRIVGVLLCGMLASRNPVAGAGAAGGVKPGRYVNSPLVWSAFNAPLGSHLGTATDQTPATRSRVNAKLAITMISVGIDMIAPFMTGSVGQCSPTPNE